MQPLSLRLPLAAAALLSLAASTLAQGRPDQVFYTDRRGELKSIACVVESADLDQVTVKVRTSDRKYDAADVDRIVFGEVPEAFREGMTYAQRGDFENAVRKLRLASEDAEARPPVQAAARFEAARALLTAAGQGDGTGFSSAIEEFDTFLGDHPRSLLVPRARALQARARLLAGEAALAGELGAALFGELSASADDAYSPTVCIEAGLAAARAFVRSGDSARAGQLYDAVRAAVTSASANLEPEDPLGPTLQRYATLADLGEGWRLLQEGKGAQAQTFFSGKLDANSPAWLRTSVLLGRGEALLLMGKHREAQLDFATVSGLDFADRDNVAQALLGLVRCAQVLPDTNAQDLQRLWLETLTDEYGDTPAATKAREMSRSL